MFETIKPKRIGNQIEAVDELDRLQSLARGGDWLPIARFVFENHQRDGGCYSQDDVPRDWREEAAGWEAENITPRRLADKVRETIARQGRITGEGDEYNEVAIAWNELDSASWFREQERRMEAVGLAEDIKRQIRELKDIIEYGDDEEIKQTKAAQNELNRLQLFIIPQLIRVGEIGFYEATKNIMEEFES